MRSVKLTIEGEFWDSQIYSGELLLFDSEGGLHKIEWGAVIDDIAQRYESVQTAVRVAFSDSDLFYNQKVRKILFDPHIQQPIKNQLNDLAGLAMSVSRADWNRHWRTETSPFEFLLTDTEVYYNQIFAAGDQGLYSTPRTRAGSGRLFTKHPTKHHDARIFQVRASDSHTAIAAAAGDDGLFEFAFKRDESDALDNERQLARRSCSACDWAFQSVMGWTANSAFLASFRQDKNPQTKRPARIFERIVDSAEMFGEISPASTKSGFTWGSREKIYRISSQGVEVMNYQPSTPKINKKTKQAPQEGPFSHRGSVNLNFDATSAVATGTAPFGTVLEFDDRLVVLRSDGIVEEFPGEPVHWRVFPRSEHYSNQLHIIYDHHIDVVSFVHDYFVDQKSKLSGFSRGGKDMATEEDSSSSKNWGR